MLLEAVEQISTRTENRTVQYQRMISYGVTLLLDPLVRWLETYVLSAQEALNEQSQKDPER